jgi:alkanesulfonate monooxygenase SsuD/methylene tetrahydromethanopterin reductase-like flavin-dependent oxidoreductase (luciferase family)
MRFGWLTLAHSPGPEQDHDAIAQQLEQAVLADTLGFDGVWLTEHNFTGEAVYCDPIPFASALAVKTTRVRIGFAVIQLALRHPVRLAVQLALLDNLSGGRLDVGVGRGSIYNEYEFVGYGLRSDDARERATEALEVLTRAWTETPFEYHGKYFDVRLPELRPRTVQRPHPPIWRSVVTPPSFKECGRLGIPIMTPRIPLARIPERLALYDEGLAEGGHDEATRSRLHAQAAVWRHVYVGESQAEAEDTLGAAVLHTREHMIHARTAFNPPDFHIDQGFLNPFTDPAVSHAEGTKWSLETGALCGTAERVAEQVAALRDVGVGHVLAQLSFGYLPHEKITASMRRFAGDVMTKFR